MALFVTNLLTIALAATVMARFYGFGHHLSHRQGWMQTIVLFLVFVIMGVPLAIALRQIGRETVTATQVRSFLNDSFGANARVTQLDIDFDRHPISVRSVIIAPRARARSSSVLEAALAKRLGRTVRLQLDQVLLDPSAGSLTAQRVELQQASDSIAAQNAEAATVVRLLSVAAGIPPEAVTLDRDHRRAAAVAAPLPGATAETYHALEQRTAAAADGWEIAIVPPLGRLPEIHFADNVVTLDQAAREAVLLSAWEAKRWNIAALAVPGLPRDGVATDRPRLNERRALAVADLLKTQGVRAVAAPAVGQTFTMMATQPEQAR